MVTRYRIVMNGGKNGKQYFHSIGSFGDKSLAIKEANRIRNSRKKGGVSYKSVRIERYET